MTGKLIDILLVEDNLGDVRLTRQGWRRGNGIPAQGRRLGAANRKTTTFAYLVQYFSKLFNTIFMNQAGKCHY